MVSSSNSQSAKLAHSSGLEISICARIRFTSRWSASPQQRFSQLETLVVELPFFDMLSAMTTAVAHIIDAVERLSPSERIELRRHIVEHLPMSDDLTDDDFAALGAASFRALDEEEAQRA